MTLMNDLEVMIRAQQYIESLANGVDPLSGQNLPDSDIVNNVRISRCLFYVSDVLKKVINNGGEVQREKLKKSQRADFLLTAEQSAALRPQDDCIFLSKVAGIINSQIDEYTMKKLKSSTINEWLMQAGLLTEVIVNGKSRKNPTAAGEEIGITLYNYRTPTGVMVKNCVYDPQAQQFIFDNIDAIAEFAANSGRNELSEDEE